MGLQLTMAKSAIRGTHLFRMTGADLAWIDGIDGYTALKMVSEVGTDMTKRENAKRFAS